MIAHGIANYCWRKIVLKVLPQVRDMGCGGRADFFATHQLLNVSGQHIRMDQITLDLVPLPSLSLQTYPRDGGHRHVRVSIATELDEG
jgi:hypothetical protein